MNHGLMDHEPSGWLLLFYILQRCVQRSRTSPQITIVDRPYLTEPAANSLKFHNHLNRLQKKNTSTVDPNLGDNGDKWTSQPSIQTRHGRKRETKQSQGRQRQSKIISAQHPDTPWETKGDEGRQSKSSGPSIQTCHGRQKKTKQNHLSAASRHAMGDNGRQRKTKQNHLSPASRHAMRDKGDKGRQRAGIILAQHRFLQELRTPHRKAVWGKKQTPLLRRPECFINPVHLSRSEAHVSS